MVLSCVYVILHSTSIYYQTSNTISTDWYVSEIGYYFFFFSRHFKWFSIIGVIHTTHCLMLYFILLTLRSLFLDTALHAAYRYREPLVKTEYHAHSNMD